MIFDNEIKTNVLLRTIEVLRTLIDCTFFDKKTDTKTSVAGTNLQGYNGFLHNVKQLRWRV
jgi:hypothetical protein